MDIRLAAEVSFDVSARRLLPPVPMRLEKALPTEGQEGDRTADDADKPAG